MGHSLIFAEGSTDSALLTAALQVIGFSPCQNIDEIPDCILSHFPKSFPSSGKRLNRVNTYPEVLRRDDDIIAIINTGGFTRLSEALKRAALLIKDDLPKSLIVFVDADDKSEADRFQETLLVVDVSFIKFVRQRLAVEGINLPQAPASIVDGNIKTGVYIWPGNGGIGTLERVLLDGIEAEFPDVYRMAYPLADEVRDYFGVGHEIHKSLSSGFDIDKARVAIMGGVLNPSSSFAVFVSKKAHKKVDFFKAPSLGRIVSFLNSAFPK